MRSTLKRAALMWPVVMGALIGAAYYTRLQDDIGWSELWRRLAITGLILYPALCAVIVRLRQQSNYFRRLRRP